MWRVIATLGLIVWFVTIVASATINCIAGAKLWRGREVVGTAIATGVWLICLATAIFAALGLVAQVRGAKIIDVESAMADFAYVERELAHVERQRRNRADTRTTKEIQAAIEQVLSRSVGDRGTVRSVSQDCELHRRAVGAAPPTTGLLPHRATHEDALKTSRERALLLARLVRFQFKQHYLTLNTTTTTASFLSEFVRLAACRRPPTRTNDLPDAS